MQKVAHRTQSFDGFTLDLTRGCLLRGVQEIKLRPKPFEALKYLVQNPGRLISKAELIQTIWPDTAVTDDSLVQCLMEVRRALGDDGQQIIKTVPRRGYIFDKEVNENGAVTTYMEETTGVHVVIEEAEESNGHGAAAAIETLANRNEIAEPRKQRRIASLIGAIKRHKIATATTAAALGAFVIAGVVFAKPILFWWFKPPSIAILPMVNATGDPNNDYLSDGLTESLITSLNQVNTPGKIPRLLVTAETTVFDFKGREPRSVGREFGVDTVLASKLLQENGKWIIKVEMIKVADGSQLWSKQYPASTDPYLPEYILKEQDEIPNDVAGKLPLKLSDAEKQRLTRRYTQNAAAYDAYLKGRTCWMKATPENYQKSIEYYHQAIDLDPNFALPYWGMGASYVLMGMGNTGVLPGKEAFAKGTEWYLKALNIDDTLSAAKHDLELQDMNAWDWAKIEKTCKKHPAYAFPWGSYLTAMGRLDEQLAAENFILSWEPQNARMHFFLGHTLFLARRYDAAIEQFQQSFKIGNPTRDCPPCSWVHSGLGHAYVQKGMFTEAIAEFNQTKDLLKDSPPSLEGLGYAYARSGQRNEALGILNQLQERADKGEYVVPIGIAWIYIGLGANDEAFLWLEKAFAEKSDLMREIKTNPIYDPLRSDPRFTDLLRRMNLPT
jgi:DNA-binding winged helix-turn-helix (wHTH) protein/TolB-like protein/Tfp pilus assembly protein PilF